MKPILHIYTRVSTLVQAEQGTSLQTQKDLGKKKAHDLGFDYRIWNEGGKSSKGEDLANRPVLTRLLLDVEDGHVQHLWVYHNDRLSRNDIAQQTIKIALQKNNVKLYTKDGEFDPSNPQDHLMKSFLDAISQYENAMRTERSRQGRLNTIRQGFWMGGPPPYGYKIEDRMLVENVDESKWIKKIYQWYVQGKPTQFIKSQLDSNGVQPRRAKGLWTLGSIQKILKNTHYLGYFTYTDKKSQDTIECSCPAFLDQRLWNAAQDRREKVIERKGQNNRTKRFYLLRDFMYCGHCGTPMGGRIKPSKNERLYYCPNKERSWVSSPPEDHEKWDRGKGCQMKRSLNIPRTDTLVWTNIMTVLQDSDYLKQKAYLEFGGDGDIKDDQAKEKKLQKKLKTKLQSIEVTLAQITTNRVLQDVDEKTYLKTRENLITAKADVSDKLEKSRVRLKDMGNREKWLDGITRFLDHLEKMETETDEQKKYFLSLFIERIDVSYDAKTKEHTLIIKFRLPIVDDDDFGDGDVRVGGFDKRAILPPFKSTPQSPTWPSFWVGPRRCL